VLVVDPETQSFKKIGDVGQGKFKYNKGVVAAGKIYGMPSHGKKILEIDVVKSSVREYGNLPANWGSKWNHGILGPDGKVYCIPFDAPSILVIDPADGSTSFIGDFGPMKYKWRVGLLGPDGKIYGIPYNFDSVLVIDTAEGSVKLLSCGSEGKDKAKWNGGMVGVDGRIYGIPAGARKVLQIDPATESVELLGNLRGGRGKKWRNCVEAPDGKIYGIPFDATSVLVIDPRSNSAWEVGDLDPQEGKWADGALGDDGRIYGIPHNATSTLVVDPVTGSICLHEAVHQPVAASVDSKMNGKWVECFKAHNGCIYGVPVHASSVLVVDTTRRRPPSQSCGELPQQRRPAKCTSQGHGGYGGHGDWERERPRRWVAKKA